VRCSLFTVRTDRYRSLAKNRYRLPQPGSVLAASFTSPVDSLYLAAIFNPIFTASYPNTRLVQPITLFQAIFRALSRPRVTPPPNARLVPLSTLIKEHPDCLIVVLPECTTSNGRGILTLSPSLLTTPGSAKIYPVSLRYTPADVTTPVPGAYLTFLWDLCSMPTHLIRVRIAEAVQNTAVNKSEFFEGFETVGTEEGDDSGVVSFSSAETLTDDSKDAAGLTAEEKKLLDRVAEDLARLGRAKRVGLGVKEKVDFVKVWTKTRKIC
jgi:1-acylglycerol-3-phosphate O-acyltransferase